MMPRHARVFLLIGLVLSISGVGYAQETPPIMLVLGDSIGEGVQSADANSATQPAAYPSILAAKIGLPLTLPLIRTNLLGVVGNTTNRSRLDPTVRAANLSVSGTDVGSLLRDRADGVIDSETDLVLLPRTGSQIEIAESLRAPFVVCWIGSNDVLAAVTSFDQLDATQLTPVADFTADLQAIVQRLTAAGSIVVLANIADVSDIAYLLDRSDLQRFLGSDFGLPEGHLTTVPAMMMVKLGLDDGSVFHDPSFLLDAAELAAIRDRIGVFNGIIAATAAAAGLPMVDVHGIFKAVAAAAPTVFGVRITARYLGGLFSLDGVHPSNLGHALIATAFIAKLNEHFHVAIPHLTLAEWTGIFRTDPFIDKDGDGRVTGRPGAGLLETLGPVLGVSGDLNDGVGFSPSATQSLQGEGDAALDAAAQRDAVAASHAPRFVSRQDAIAQLRRVFGSAHRQLR